MNRLRISPRGLRVFRGGFMARLLGESCICGLSLLDRFRVFLGGLRIIRGGFRARL